MAAPGESAFAGVAGAVRPSELASFMDLMESLEDEECDFGAQEMFGGVRGPRSVSARFRLCLMSAFRAFKSGFCELM